MKPLLLLLALPFAADTDALGDRDFATRHSATLRLSAAGWRALPALTLAAEDEQPERADRAQQLLLRLRLDAVLARLLLEAPADAAPDALLLPLRVALCEQFAPLGVLSLHNPDGGGGAILPAAGVYEWSLRAPHYGGSPERELRLLLDAARRQRSDLRLAVIGSAAAVK